MPYKVEVTVHAIIKNKCSQGFKNGDSWLIDDEKTPGSMCAGACNSIAPAIRLIRLSGEIPGVRTRTLPIFPPPDPERILIYEVRRLHKINL